MPDFREVNAPIWPTNSDYLVFLSVLFLSWPSDLVELFFWGVLRLAMPAGLVRRFIFLTVFKEVVKLYLAWQPMNVHVSTSTYFFNSVVSFVLVNSASDNM
jgi:hypothetical protein